jgi:D-alanine--D-alanine ligase
MKKLRVAVLYGGRSGEHEVSLQSAASVINYLDRDRFEIVPVAIDKQGRWHLNDISLIEGKKSLPVFKDAPRVVLPPNSTDTSALVGLGGSEEPKAIDVVFPVVHGPLCEDGTIQGLLELADVPYVGCGVLASAVAMDKEVAKRLVRDAGVPTVCLTSRSSMTTGGTRGLGHTKSRKSLGPRFLSNQRISDRALACIRSGKRRNWTRHSRTHSITTQES